MRHTIFIEVNTNKEHEMNKEQYLEWAENNTEWIDEPLVNQQAILDYFKNEFVEAGVNPEIREDVIECQNFIDEGKVYDAGYALEFIAGETLNSFVESL